MDGQWGKNRNRRTQQLAIKYFSRRIIFGAGIALFACWVFAWLFVRMFGVVLAVTHPLLVKEVKKTQIASGAEKKGREKLPRWAGIDE